MLTNPISTTMTKNQTMTGATRNVLGGRASVTRVSSLGCVSPIILELSFFRQSSPNVPCGALRRSLPTVHPLEMVHSSARPRIRHLLLHQRNEARLRINFEGSVISCVEGSAARIRSRSHEMGVMGRMRFRSSEEEMSAC